MSQGQVDDGKTDGERIAEEDKIQEKVDAKGNRWRKVYFGGGSHFRNWYDQIVEIKGEDNVEVEEINSHGFKCYEEGGEKLYRIWVKANVPEEKT